MDANELIMLQSLPLEIKIAKSKRRIREAIDYFGLDGIYVPVSGGLDSTVLSHIVEQVQKEDGIPKERIPRVNSNTGNEHDEVLELARKLSDIEVRPKRNLIDVLTNEGYPIGSKLVSVKIRVLQNPTENNKATTNLYKTGVRQDGVFVQRSMLAKKWESFVDSDIRVSEKCCDILKKEPLHRYEKETGRKPIIGTMADEGGVRRKGYLNNGCNAFSAGKSMPIGFWTKYSILEYILTYDIEYAKGIYGDIVEIKNNKIPSKLKLRLMNKYGRRIELKTTGERRTGCVWCMLGIDFDDKNNNRFQTLEKLDPRKYKFAIQGGTHDDKGKWIPKGGLGLWYVLDKMNIPYRAENEKGQLEGQMSVDDYMEV